MFCFLKSTHRSLLYFPDLVAPCSLQMVVLQLSGAWVVVVVVFIAPEVKPPEQWLTTPNLYIFWNVMGTFPLYKVVYLHTHTVVLSFKHDLSGKSLPTQARQSPCWNVCDMCVTDVVRTCFCLVTDGRLPPIAPASCFGSKYLQVNDLRSSSDH